MDEDGDEEDDDGGGHLLSICIPSVFQALYLVSLSPILHMRQRLLRKVGKFAQSHTTDK